MLEPVLASRKTRAQLAGSAVDPNHAPTMSDVTSDLATEQQRYPIGRFARRDSYSRDERAAHIARLEAQPERLREVIDGFTDADWEAPYRPGGWTVRQLVHHIADSHLNAFLRVKLGLTEATPTIKPYDQDAWVQLADARLDPSVSVALLTATHARFVAVLIAMTSDDFARDIMHPETGRMTLDQVVALYAWHGDHHLAQLEAYRAQR